MTLGPGTILVCRKWWIPEPIQYVPECFGAAFELTEGAIYTCEEIIEGGDLTGGSGFFRCPWDDCGVDAIGVKQKKCAHGNCIPYCPNLFRPLNDGDTSLVEDEKEDNRDDLADALAYGLQGMKKLEPSNV